MKRLILVGLLSLVTANYLLAEEYLSDDYFNEISSQFEELTMDESLPIAKTIEDQVKEKNFKEKIAQEELLKQEELIQEETIITHEVKEESKTVQSLSYETVLKQAKSEDKIIMLAIRSTSCKYCDKMEAETLSDESVKEALASDFLTIHYNQDLESLPLGLQNGATPMFIFVNKKEDILNMYPGIRNPSQFKEVLKEILSK